MGSIKKICERSKWFHGLQSLLPAPKILAFNDWMSSRDRNKAVKPTNQMGLIVCDTYLLTWVFSPCFKGAASKDLTSAADTYRQINNKQEAE